MTTLSELKWRDITDPEPTKEWQSLEFFPNGYGVILNATVRSHPFPNMEYQLQVVYGDSEDYSYIWDTPIKSGLLTRNVGELTKAIANVKSFPERLKDRFGSTNPDDEDYNPDLTP